MTLYDDLKQAAKENETIKLDEGMLIDNMPFKKESQFGKPRENVFNSNNGVYNIYDGVGNCFATTDNKLVESLSKKYPELKKDENMGVILSNGDYINDSETRGQWNCVRDNGREKNKAAAKVQDAKDIEREKAMKLAALRGTAKTAPAPVRKSELGNALSGKVAGLGAEM